MRKLCQAERVDVALGPDDWTLLTAMGAGAKKAVAAGGDVTYESAQRACMLIRKEFFGTSGEKGYRLDDLICLCACRKTRRRLTRPRRPCQRLL